MQNFLLAKGDKVSFLSKQCGYDETGDDPLSSFVSGP